MVNMACTVRGSRCRGDIAIRVRAVRVYVRCRWRIKQLNGFDHDLSAILEVRSEHASTLSVCQTALYDADTPSNQLDIDHGDVFIYESDKEACRAR